MTQRCLVDQRAIAALFALSLGACSGTDNSSEADGGTGGGGDDRTSTGGMTVGSGGSHGSPGNDASVAGNNASTGGSSGTGGTENGGGGTADAGTIDLGPVMEPGDPGPSDVQLTVRADMALHAISPWIYGTNGASDIDNTHQTVIRSGGNRLTAYNWENNASNAGSDWYFQNDDLLSSSDTPGQAIADVVEQALNNDAASVITVPIVDYVAADKNGGGDVRNSGSNYLQTRFRQNQPTKGAALSTTPDATDDYVYQDEMVAWLKGAYPNSTVKFSMDNEPDLWSSTHAEVHPDPVTYAELWQRNRDYAAAVKSVWSEAEILGFVSYGFNGYVNLQNAPDGNGRDFIEWYLDQAKAEDVSGGGRIIDYLDLHWYSEAQGDGARITDAGNSAGAVSAREQAPRSLWDSSYSETSWIHDYLGGPINLLHWLGDKIDAHYPGTKLSFSEWNYGGGDHISGAIAVADVLGIFGRESVGLATYWPLKSDESFAYAGFRAFRNYDGSGGTFGDTSISANTSDTDRVSVYASIDSKHPDRTVLVVINKDTAVVNAGITVAQAVAYSSAKVYQLTGAQAQLQSATALTPTATNAFNYMMPAQSVSVVVLAP